MCRVLVFDDDPQICDLLEAALRDAGFTVRRAVSPEEARQGLEEGPISVALIDTPMVNFVGVEFAVHAAARGVKILMMAAGEDATLDVEVLGLRCVLKPFRIADIVDQVRAMLSVGDSSETTASRPIEDGPDGRD
jgi:DNA-binding response OmpR family regulator